jgi:ABC-type transport system involved in cytochrome c biogenesis permease subunit
MRPQLDLVDSMTYRRMLVGIYGFYAALIAIVIFSVVWNSTLPTGPSLEASRSPDNPTERVLQISNTK